MWSTSFPHDAPTLLFPFTAEGAAGRLRVPRGQAKPGEKRSQASSSGGPEPGTELPSRPNCLDNYRNNGTAFAELCWRLLGTVPWNMNEELEGMVEGTQNCRPAFSLPGSLWFPPFNTAGTTPPISNNNSYDLLDTCWVPSKYVQCFKHINVCKLCKSFWRGY